MRNNPVNRVDLTGHRDDGPGEVLSREEIDELEKKKNEKQPDLANEPPPPEDDLVVEFVAIVVFSTDWIAYMLSLGEMIYVDRYATATIGVGCATAIGCGPAIADAAAVDFLISGETPLAIAENILGGVSLAGTLYIDAHQGKFSYTPDSGLFVERDTFVATRNFLIGLVPAANIDFLASRAQLIYDEGRSNGTIAGGSEKLTPMR